MTAVSLAAAALTISGCGGSPKPLTRAELTAKADAICRTVIAKLKTKTKTINSQQDIARIAPELSALEQTALAELGKLVPPAELESDWKQFVAGAQTLADDTAKLGEYAKMKNLKAAKGLIDASVAVQHQMTATAKRDGLKDCEQVA
ncbi:MAG TPA: hypothetical protein VFV03_01805 [Solirubrobacteraceae bacterium]|nr:hypothetical protein [Solirubrobacteraceae bacterium]